MIYPFNLKVLNRQFFGPALELFFGVKRPYLIATQEADDDRVDGRRLGCGGGGGGGGAEEEAAQEVLRVDVGAQVAAAVHDDGAPGRSLSSFPETHSAPESSASHITI